MKYTGKGDDVKYVISPAELVHFFWAAASNMELVPDVGSKCWFRKYDGTSLVTQEWVDKHNEMLLGEYGMYIEDALDDIEKSVEKVSHHELPAVHKHGQNHTHHKARNIDLCTTFLGKASSVREL